MWTYFGEWQFIAMKGLLAWYIRYIISCCRCSGLASVSDLYYYELHMLACYITRIQTYEEIQ